jgi:hypothetical protein
MQPTTVETMHSEELRGRRTRTREVAADESFSEAVVSAVADVSDTDPVPDPAGDGAAALDPLFTAVDPDALDAVFGGGSRADGANGRITFAYSGHEVSVHSEGRVSVTRLDRATETSN